MTMAATIEDFSFTASSKTLAAKWTPISLIKMIVTMMIEISLIKKMIVTMMIKISLIKDNCDNEDHNRRR